MRELSGLVTEVDWTFKEQEPLIGPDESLLIPNIKFYRETDGGKTMHGRTVSLEELQEKGWATPAHIRHFRTPQGLDAVRASAEEPGIALVSEQSYEPGEFSYAVEGLPKSPMPLPADRPGLKLLSLGRHGGIRIGVEKPPAKRSASMSRGWDPETGVRIQMGGRDVEQPTLYTGLDVMLRGRAAGHELRLSIAEKAAGKDAPKWGVAFEYGAASGQPSALFLCEPVTALKRLGLASLELGEQGNPMHSAFAPDGGDWYRVVMPSTDLTRGVIESVQEKVVQKYSFPSEPLNFAATGLKAYLNLGDISVHPLDVLRPS